MPRKYFFSEAEIENSLKECRSVSAAARFLKIDYRTMKRFAEKFGLFEKYKNQGGKGIRKFRAGRVALEAILDGWITIKNKYYLKKLLIREMVFEEKCSRCGYKDKRILDHRVPLVLDFVDGDESNQQLYNLRLLCPNCYFIEKGEKRVTRVLKEYEDQIPSMNH
ncbi:HNH endonuclease [candidate division KSB1 bacterium]|nr:HNH endonuclease [candidate division KSB1 bacterium]